MSAENRQGEEKGRRALVTGGAGFIGSHLVDGLLHAGWSVRVLDDLSTGNERNLSHASDQIEFVSGSVCDEPTCEAAMEDVEVVFHQAALPSVPKSVAQPLLTNHVNLSGTLCVLEKARHAGVRRVVFAASSSAYGDTRVLPKVETLPATPQSPYALQKYGGEVYCGLYFQLYGLETVALRYFNIFGPRQNPNSDYAAVIPSFASAAIAGTPPVIYGDGEQTRDFTYVENAVQANLAAADAPRAPGQVINVAAGERTSLNELWSGIKKLVGVEFDARYAEKRAGDVRDSLADLTRAKELLGYKPSIDIHEGLRRTVDSLKS
jgi:nucleoside-diphosphate-sugar epimerase